MSIDDEESENENESESDVITKEVGLISSQEEGKPGVDASLVTHRENIVEEPYDEVFIQAQSLSEKGNKWNSRREKRDIAKSQAIEHLNLDEKSSPNIPQQEETSSDKKENENTDDTTFKAFFDPLSS